MLEGYDLLRPSSETRLSDSSSLTIDFHGLFQSPMSWAHVSRELALALDRIGCTVAVKAHRGFCYSPSFHMEPQLRVLRQRNLSKHIALAFAYPLHYSRLDARFKVGLLVYESTRMPCAWVEEIERHLDVLVVPSRFCAEVAIESGVSPDRLEIVPYGYDPLVYRPRQPETAAGSQRSFTFLCVAMPHRRKGLVELVDAFVQEFVDGEPVRLLIKLPYVPKDGRGTQYWEIPECTQWLKRLSGSMDSSGRMQIISKVLTPCEMAHLYAACDAYVQPSYGEGFGLSILEAKAMGLPTVVTGWGGHMDYCTDENSFLVDYDLVPAGQAQYDNGPSDAYMARPKVSSLRAMMRMVYAHAQEVEVRVRRSYADIAPLTWDAAARRLAGVLSRRVGLNAA